MQSNIMDIPQKPVIVFLINSLAGGGAERVMLRLITHSEHLRDRFEMHLVLLDDEARAYTPPAWVIVHQLNTKRSLLRGASSLHALFRNLRPSACLSFLARANYLNAVLGKLIGFRTIISERVHTTSHFSTGRSATVSRILVRLLYPLADSVVAVSQGIKDDLRECYGVSAEKITVIPNPVDISGALERSKEATTLDIHSPYMIVMGRLTKIKNVELAVRAFAKSDYRGHLIILGEGPEFSNIEDLIQKLEIGPRVQLVGFSNNPFPYLAGADAYVLPSNAEGFPNGLVEAMAVGAPVIATNCETGPSEILNDTSSIGISELTIAKYGILVPPNSVDAMAQAMDYLVPVETQRTLSAKSREGAGRYGLEKAVSSYWSIIADL